MRAEPVPRRRLLLGAALLGPLAGCGGDPATSTPPPPSPWRVLAPLSAGPRQECGVALLNGDVYVAGGFDGNRTSVATVEAYRIATDTWRAIAPLPQPLHHVNLASAGNALYVLGALQGAGFVATGVVYSYDATSNPWANRAAMPAGTERGASAVAVIGSLVYVAGGARATAVTQFSAYDTVANAWQSLPPMPVASEHFVSAAVGGRLYAIGGRNAAGLRNEVQVFDPATASWSTARPMPTARGGIVGAALNGRIHVLGGEGNTTAASGVFAQHEVYDPVSDTWSTLSPMRTPRHGAGAVSANGQLFVPGGATVEGYGAVAINEAFAP